MAKIDLKKLEDQLSCPICLDTYSDPKQLQCHHVYCSKCLVKLVRRDENQQLCVNCPNCRQLTPVPPKGVRGIQSAFQTNQLLEMLEEHKKAKVTASLERGEAEIPACKAICCSEHDEIEVALYCETCGETICWKCIMKGSKHHSHDYEELNEAFVKYKKEIDSFLRSLQEQADTNEKALALFTKRRDEIMCQRESTEAEIRNAVKVLQDILEVRGSELIMQLDKLTQAKLKRLGTQKDKIDAGQTDINNCLHVLREIFAASNQTEALTKKCATIKQVKKISTAYEEDYLTPNTDADIMFFDSDYVTKDCQAYGKVVAVGSLDLSKCCAKGNAIKTATFGKESCVVLQTHSFKNLSFNVPEDSIQCEIISDITGSRARGRVERRKQAEYSIKYFPTLKGMHRLSIRVNGQHIKGSPFPVFVSIPPAQLGTPILSRDGMQGPMGVAVNQSGKIVVTEWNGHSVSVISPSGAGRITFGTFGTEKKQLHSPCGVAVDDKGDILVADYGNHQIKKFTAEGEFLAAVGTKGSGPLKFYYPKGIAFNSKNGRVYVGNDNNSIQILNFDLSYYKTFGRQGSENGEFDTPWFLACHSDGNVYVADSDNHRIQVFTAEGEFLRKFGRNGKDGGDLSCPRGIAVGKDGTVYVSEYCNHRVSLFSSQGDYITSFGYEDDGENKDDIAVGLQIPQKRQCLKEHPCGLVVDRNGIIYVCNFGHNCIQLF